MTDFLCPVSQWNIYMQQIAFVLRFWYWQTTRGQKSTRRKWMLHYFMNVWVNNLSMKVVSFEAPKITYSLSLHESYQLWYFDFEQYFICIILDTRHRENLQNRGTGNPYQNQNMTWTGMHRMAFQCRQWYRMELWEPLMEHRGAPVANISVATEGRRVL